jgi:dihydroorotase
MHHKPNLQPPITTVAAALSYRERLQALAPHVTFLMTLYLHPSITPAHIAEAAAAGIVGVKAYPVGLTTHSEAGVVDYEAYYSVFEAMQEHDLVLNLHGEAPSTPATTFMSADGKEAITVLNAEAAFLPTLHKIHAAFPRLRILLESIALRKTP